MGWRSRSRPPVTVRPERMPSATWSRAMGGVTWTGASPATLAACASRSGCSEACAQTTPRRRCRFTHRGQSARVHRTWLESAPATRPPHSRVEHRDVLWAVPGSRANGSILAERPADRAPGSDLCGVTGQATTSQASSPAPRAQRTHTPPTNPRRSPRSHCQPDDRLDTGNRRGRGLLEQIELSGAVGHGHRKHKCNRAYASVVCRRGAPKKITSISGQSP